MNERVAAGRGQAISIAAAVARQAVSVPVGTVPLVSSSLDLLGRAEQRRVASLAALDPEQQAARGQYFTPEAAARLIASMPRLPKSGTLRVLDPGAGSGSLTAAFFERVLEEAPDLVLDVTTVELDEALAPVLSETVRDCQDTATAVGCTATTRVIDADYLVNELQLGPFDLVIMNPPYGKLAARSVTRDHVAAATVDTPNLYAAFMATAIESLAPDGQLVAITPRSFANGAYFEVFRKYLLDRLAIDRIHIFASRSTVFADTGVLQENIILSGTRGGMPEAVTLSTSTGHRDEVVHLDVAYADIVHPSDEHQFIRIPASDSDAGVVALMADVPCTLADLGLTVSTGRVVDFRSRDQLVEPPLSDHYPMVYPSNVKNGEVRHPVEGGKPQRYSIVDDRDARLLVPEGVYVLVKRFSAKEERRRIVAGLWDPAVNSSGPVAFDNKLNYIHLSGQGLDGEVAAGLSLWLNSTPVDAYFRTFSGHTQVNATDLRAMRFPNEATLRQMGSLHPTLPEQDEVDAAVESALSRVEVAA